MPTNNTKNIYTAEYEDVYVPSKAEDISFSTAISGLHATNVQGAIDELVTSVAVSRSALKTAVASSSDFSDFKTIVAGW